MRLYSAVQKCIWRAITIPSQLLLILRDLFHPHSGFTVANKLIPVFVCRCVHFRRHRSPRPGLGYLVYDGDLLDLPVYLVAPADVPMTEVKALAQKMDAMADKSDARNPIDVTRLVRFYGRVRERYMASSSKTERIYAPAGTGHLFPYQTPEFVVEVVRKMLREHPL